VVPRALTPVGEYLKTQDRFSHLFEPAEKVDAVAAIQESVNRYWIEAGSREGFQVKVPEQSSAKAPSA